MTESVRALVLFPDLLFVVDCSAYCAQWNFSQKALGRDFTARARPFQNYFPWIFRLPEWLLLLEQNGVCTMSGKIPFLNASSPDMVARSPSPHLCPQLDRRDMALA
jgi:hypothetical protein